MELKVNKIQRDYFQTADSSGRVIYTTLTERRILSLSTTTIFRGDGTYNEVVAVFMGRSVFIGGQEMQESDVLFNDKFWGARRKFMVEQGVYKFKSPYFSTDLELFRADGPKSPNPLAIFTVKSGLFSSSPERGSIIISRFGMEDLWTNGHPTTLFDQALIVSVLVRADQTRRRRNSAAAGGGGGLGLGGGGGGFGGGGFGFGGGGGDGGGGGGGGGGDGGGGGGGGSGGGGC